jgi:hypothetical protein
VEERHLGPGQVGVLRIRSPGADIILDGGHLTRRYSAEWRGSIKGIDQSDLTRYVLVRDIFAIGEIARVRFMVATAKFEGRKEKSSRNQQSNNSRSFLRQKVGEQQPSRQARLPGTEWQRVSPGNGATAKQP